MRSSTFDYQRQENAALQEKAKKNPGVFGEVKFTSLWYPSELTIALAGTADHGR